MAENNSLIGGEALLQQMSIRVIIVQILVMMFLCINFLFIITFFKKEYFYTVARYILFAVILLSDSLILFLSNILVLFTYFNLGIQVWICISVCVVPLLYMILTPVTLTAMTLERYVAICMPLRHAELCSIHSTLRCILIIHGLSSVPCIIVLSTFFASATHSYYTQSTLCSVEMFIIYGWQSYTRSAVYQSYFLIMFITIVFTYVEIMKVAKGASGKNKKSTLKGLRTVTLHAFQLLLCLIQLWCPFIEAAALQIHYWFFRDIRYFNYIIFNLLPKCLSPFIYGIRDEKFFHALKNYAFFGLFRKIGRYFNWETAQCTN